MTQKQRSDNGKSGYRADLLKETVPRQGHKQRAGRRPDIQSAEKRLARLSLMVDSHSRVSTLRKLTADLACQKSQRSLSRDRNESRCCVVVCRWKESDRPKREGPGSTAISLQNVWERKTEADRQANEDNENGVADETLHNNGQFGLTASGPWGKARSTKPNLC